MDKAIHKLCMKSQFNHPCKHKTANPSCTKQRNIKIQDLNWFHISSVQANMQSQQHISPSYTGEILWIFLEDFIINQVFAKEIEKQHYQQYYCPTNNTNLNTGFSMPVPLTQYTHHVGNWKSNCQPTWEISRRDIWGIGGFCFRVGHCAFWWNRITDFKTIHHVKYLQYCTQQISKEIPFLKPTII